jgi:4-hydroxy-tetrahydrodipicolinate synthase
VGSESFLLADIRHGGPGCISAPANVNTAPNQALYAAWEDAAAEVQQAKLNIVRDVFGKKYTMIAALKQAIAHFGDDPTWVTVRPPLLPLSADQSAAFITELQQIGFTMPGLKRACAHAVT